MNIEFKHKRRDTNLMHHRRENYLINSYVSSLRRRWCMNHSCSTCGATDLCKLLFESAIGNEISDDEKKELMQITRFYPRTSILPEAIKEKVISSHINEFNKIEKGGIENVDMLVEQNSGKTIYRCGFKDFLRFMVMDIWYSLDHSLSHFDRLEQLKSGITSIEVLDVVVEMNNHFQSLRNSKY
jgi:hypothetical protein